MPCYVVYFERSDGTIFIPPDHTTPTPDGMIRRECQSISEVHALERRMQQEARDRAEQEAEGELARTLERQRQIRRHIMTSIESSSTSQYDKDFLRAWCQLRDDKRREHYKRLFQQREAYFESLHYDKPRNAEEVLKESL